MAATYYCSVQGAIPELPPTLIHPTTFYALLRPRVVLLRVITNLVPMVKPSIRSAWDGYCCHQLSAVGIIFQPFGITISAAVSNFNALGAYDPGFCKPDLYCLAGVSNTVVPVRVCGNLVTNG